MQLNAEVEAIEADRLAQQPAVQVLETELKELNQEIKVLNKQHGALNADIRALKQEGQAVADEVWLVLSLNVYSLISAPLRLDCGNAGCLYCSNVSIDHLFLLRRSRIAIRYGLWFSR